MSESTSGPLGQLSAEELGRRVEAAIFQYLREEWDAEAVDGLSVDQNLWQQLDSMLMLDLVARLEREFDIRINASDLRPDRIGTIAALRDFTVGALRKAP